MPDRPKRHTTEETDRRRRPAAVLATLLVAALLMASCVYGMWRLRQNELNDEAASLRRLSLTLAEQTGLAFRELDMVLRETRQAYLRGDRSKNDPAALHRELRERFTDLPQGQALLVFGPDGGMLAHSREYPTPKINVADRAYFRMLRAPSDDLYISRPMRNRVNGRWMISLARRIPGGAAEFGGVVMAAVELEYFWELYRALNLPEGARLNLLRDDGAILLASPFDESRLGREAESSPATGELRAQTPVAGLPLTVRLELPETEALRGWRLHMLAAFTGMLAIAAGVAALTAARRAHLRELHRRTELLARSERALRESEARHRTIVETASEGVCVFDAARRIVYANRVMARMLGDTESSLVGRPLTDLFGPDGAAGDTDWIFTGGRREVRLKGGGGADVWALTSSAPLGDDLTAPGGAFAMFADITERKEREKFREGIEGILRHDLRSPLTSMSYIPRMVLAEGGLSNTQRWSLTEMERYVRRMLRMVDAYLKLSGIERADYRPEPHSVDLAALAAEAGRELQPLMDAGGKRLAIIGGETPVVMEGEEALLATMLVNLVKNALEAAPRDSAVTLELAGADRDVHIAVRNPGAVPPAIRARFFQKYVTAGKSRGTGLGAYSARLIVEAHGGAIALDTSDPEATTIRVRLPRRARTE